MKTLTICLLFISLNFTANCQQWYTDLLAATAANTPSALAKRDANGNLICAAHVNGYTTTATAAGTTTLTVASTYLQYFTGATTQTVVLPVTSTLVQGQAYEINNLSTGAVTVQSSGANTINILAAGTSGIFTCILTSGTGTASWSAWYGGIATASAKKLTVSNTMTLASADGASVTLPNTGTIDGGWTYVRVSGSDATTTGQALVDITGLVSATLTNSTKYEIEVFLDVTTSTGTNGTQYGIATGGSGGASVVNVLCTGTTTTNAATTVTISTAATATAAFLTTASINGIIKMSGVVTTRGSGTANISIQHLKVTSGTSTVRLGASYFRYRLAAAF